MSQVFELPESRDGLVRDKINSLVEAVVEVGQML